MNISLACYSVRLRKVRSDKYLRLRELGPDESLLDAFRTYFRDLMQDHAYDPNNRRLLRVIKLLKPREDRLIRGVVNAGRYGYGAELFDVEEGNVTYNRTPVEAEMMPFYFLVDVPPRLSTGVMVLQRRGPFGIRTDLTQDFIAKLRKQYPKVRLELSPLIPPDLLDEYLGNGRFTKLRLVRRMTTRDIASSVLTADVDDEAERVEITYSSGRNRRLRIHEQIVDVVRGRRRVNELVELREVREDSGFEYTGAKAELVVGRTRKTIDLFSPAKMRSLHEVTDQVDLDQDGHPVFESIDGIARSLKDRLIGQLGERGNTSVE